MISIHALRAVTPARTVQVLALTALLDAQRNAARTAIWTGIVAKG